MRYRVKGLAKLYGRNCKLEMVINCMLEIVCWTNEDLYSPHFMLELTGH